MSSLYRKALYLSLIIWICECRVPCASCKNRLFLQEASKFLVSRMNNLLYYNKLPKTSLNIKVALSKLVLILKEPPLKNTFFQESQ